MVSSDITMAPMNGYEFVRKVKKINPKVNVVLLTDFEIEDKEFSNELLSDVKVDAFIKKPFSPNTLRNIVLQHSAK